MNDQDAEQGARAVPGRLATCAAAALVFGLAEWGLDGRFGAGLPFGDALRALATVALVYGAAGVVLGGVLRVLGCGAGALPAVLTLLLTTRALQEGLAHSWLLALAAVALGWAFHALLLAVLRRAPRIGEAEVWGSAALGLWLAALLTQWPAALDLTGRIGIGALALTALALLALGGRTRRAAALGIAVLALGCGALGMRLPDASATTAAAPDAPCVLLVTIDTLRADHVGAYGYAAARTPNLDGLAREGTLFRQVVTQNVFTGPSHSTILSGLLPEHHGVVLNRMRLPGRVAALPEILREAGWVSAAFIGGYTTRDDSVGLPSRFDYHDEDLRAFRLLPESVFRLSLLRPVARIMVRAGIDVALRWPLYRPAEGVTDVAVEWLERAPEDAPFLVWAHYFDPHLPYMPPQRFLGEAERAYRGPADGRYFRLKATERAEIVADPASVTHMIGLYDAEIAYADEQLGRLVAAARAASGSRALLIVVTSDHGESMGEHGLYWNRDLYDATLLVPLVVVEPGAGAARVPEVAAQVRLMDLTPTILDLLGVEPPYALDGRSIAALLHGAPDPEPRPAHSGVYRFAGDFDRASFGVRTEAWKLMTRPAGWRGGTFGPWLAAERELYDLAADPGELENRAAERPAERELLEEELRSLGRGAGNVGVELSPEVLKALRSLGYAR